MFHMKQFIRQTDYFFVRSVQKKHLRCNVYETFNYASL